MHFIEQSVPTTDLAALGRMAKMELQELLRQRGEINKRIEVLRKTIRALLAGECIHHNDPAVRMTPRKRQGLAHACRMVLRQASMPMTRNEIVEALRRANPDEASRHRDLPVAVSAVLRHLLESGEANNLFNEEGHRTWFAVHKENRAVDAPRI